MQPPDNRSRHAPVADAQQDEHQRLVQELQLHQLELQMQNEELREAHQALQASRDLYQDLYEQAPVGYLSLSVDGIVEAINQTGASLLKVPSPQLLGRRFSNHVAPADRDHWHIALVKVCQSLEPQECELTLLRPGGQPWRARLNCVKHEYAPAIVRVTLTDLTARRQVESRLNLAASVFTHAREAIMVTDPAGNIVEINDAFTTITGYSRDEALGRNSRFMATPGKQPDPYPALWRSLEQDHHWQGLLWNRRRNGDTFASRQTISAILDSSGEVQNYVALFTDSTELHEYQRQLEYVAHYDPLTRLPNRTLLAVRLQQAMAHAQAQGRSLALAYLDLDGFKAINDAHGHEVGDKVLAISARRMNKTLRDGCTLARLGGDEFVALIVDLEQVGDSAAMLERLLVAASDTMQVDQLALRLSASIGVSYYPQASEVGADQLLRQADQAMYQAKLAGKNRLHVFDACHDLDLRGHNARLDRIEQAVRGHELRLFYQPKVNLRSGAVVGAEALVRWQHPERGLLTPENFLPLVESNALAEHIGDWVLDAVLAQMQAWGQQGLQLPVSINVGARQLQHPDFVAKLTQGLAAYPQVAPERLMIEILETSALENIEEVSRTIRTCAALGVRFALDDFGTGYSSLNYLKRLPVTQVKIDQSFIKDMLDSSKDIPILQAILELASAFGHEIIAEGVDSPAQGARLLQLGCELCQGFGIAEPMPASELPAWRTRWEHSRGWHG
ncbi:EAL domain-containing protein [Pseudomonas sp. App30]|uniref:sensor domain-containing protein n=1 Tax=Pseudomonas sp. App30 TaxID=3068990 RepID=UPI003A800C8D